MSLSTWFRDYIYIPLGGNRVATPRYVLNIMTVWMLTGFWHGADWNFMLWGGFFGIMLLIERFFAAAALEKMPGFLRHLYVMLIVMVGWVFFDAAGFGDAFAVLGRMLGLGANAFAGFEAVYYLRSYALPFVFGIIASTPLLKNIAVRLDAKQTLMLVLEPVALLLLLLAATAKMVDGSFNPFIYFRF